MKGNASTHLPNERYRSNYDAIFRAGRCINPPEIDRYNLSFNKWLGSEYIPVVLPECEILHFEAANEGIPPVGSNYQSIETNTHFEK